MEFNNEIQDAIDRLQKEAYGPHAQKEYFINPSGVAQVAEITSPQAHLLSYQIQSRKELYKTNMEHIDSQTLGIDSKIMMLDTAFPGRTLDSVVVRRKSGLEQELHSLHSDRRRERLALFGDLQKLYTELQEVVDEYQDDASDNSIVGGDMIEGYSGCMQQTKPDYWQQGRPALETLSYWK